MLEAQFSKLMKNTFIFALANLITKMTQYIVVALITHKLTRSQYGTADLVIQTAFLLVPIISCDVASSLFRFSMDQNESKDNIFSNAMAIMCTAIGFALSLYPIISKIYFIEDQLIYIYILTISQILQKSVKEFTRGIGETSLYVIGGLINSVTQLVGVYVLVYILNLSLTGYLISLSLAYLIEFVMLVILSKSIQYLSIKNINRNMIVKIMRYSIPLAPSSVMWWITAASDRYFIYYFEGASATGLYAISAMIPALITIISGIFLQSWQISAIDEYDSNNRDFFYTKAFSYLWGVTSILVCVVLITLKPMVALLVAKEYHSAWIYAPFLVFGTLFSSMQAFLGTNYAAAKDTLGALKSTVLMAIANIIFNYILIKRFAMQGAAFATMASYMFVCIYRYFDTKKYINIILEVRKMVLTISILSVVLVLSFYANIYTYVISLMCFTVLILMYLNIFKQLTINILKILSKRKG